MAKSIISSTRDYYRELSGTFKIDSGICQTMRKRDYKELYDNYIYGNKTKIISKYLSYQ